MTRDNKFVDLVVKNSIELMASGYRLFGELTDSDMDLVDALATLITTARVRADDEFMQAIGERV